ncbi:MAG TPA: ABC transporter permease [Gemmatimonadaceae bacterium]|nr:ABC transporter permease [Gemmatimonadaceae bacterium]
MHDREQRANRLRPPDTPRTLPPAWRRWRPFFRRSAQLELDDELRYHLEMRTADYVARGLSPDEARRRALERLGELKRVRDACLHIDRSRERHMRLIETIATVRNDVVFALRTFRRQTLTAVIAVLCLALGIGATTTMFSVGNALLLRALPFPNGDRLVSLDRFSGREQYSGVAVTSIPDFLEWRARSRAFDAMGIFRPGSMTLGGAEPVRLRAARVSSGVFRALGLRPVAGRLFAAEDDRPGGPALVLVSRGLAEQQLGGASRAVGQVLQLDGAPYEVIGVLPGDARFPVGVDVWRPLVLDPGAGWGDRGYEVVAALLPGVTLAQARDDAARVAAEMRRVQPRDDADEHIAVSPLRERYVGAARPAFLLLGAAAVLVFLIACANVATLQLARTAARHSEIAVRTALGASRRRIVRQLLTESMLFAIAGGGLGILLARWGSGIVGGAIASNAAPWMRFGVDGRVLAFTLVASVVAGALFGVVPAMRLAGADPGDTLRSTTRGTARMLRGRLHRVLVVVELALSLVLLVGAAFAVQSFLRLQHIDPGFDARGVMTFQFALQGPRYDSASARALAVERMDEAIARLPGVVAAGATTRIPVGNCCSRFSLNIEGRDFPPGEVPVIPGNMVTPGFLHAMGIPILHGRGFTDRDRAGARQVAIVSETFATTYFPGGDALGKRINMDGALATIVGVAADIKQERLIDGPQAEFYRPYAQHPWDNMTFAVKAPSVDGTALVRELRAVVHEVDPSLAIYSVHSMDHILARATASQRLYGLLLSVFACVALALAIAGVYGVVAFYVSRRTPEIGMRVALGAEPEAIVRMVVWQGTVLAAAGMVLGLGGAVLAARALSHVLYGVSAGEPLLYAGSAVMLMLTAILATWVPARRASRVDPMVALRAE